MVALQNYALRAEKNADNEHPLVQIGLLCAAGLFVSVFLLTYGIELSPGLFRNTKPPVRAGGYYVRLGQRNRVSGTEPISPKRSIGSTNRVEGLTATKEEGALRHLPADYRF